MHQLQSLNMLVTSPNWSGLAGDSAWLYYNNKTNKTSHIDGYSVCPNKIDNNKLKKILKLKINHSLIEKNHLIQEMRG